MNLFLWNMVKDKTRLGNLCICSSQEFLFSASNLHPDYSFILFTLSFFLSWLGFAVIWYAIMFFHGDFEPDNLPDRQGESGWKPCVYAINDFRSCLLFSIETQHTIGYGSRQTTEECVEGIVVMSFQSVVGVMIQACMVGIIFAKLSRPKISGEGGTRERINKI